jgi:U3 small nucleolar RNA-associated protein 7
MSSAPAVETISFDAVETTPGIKLGQVQRARKKRKKSKASSDKGAISDRIAAYTRAEPIETKGVTNKKFKRSLKQANKKNKEGAEKAARAEILLPSQPGYLEAEGPDRTWRFSQTDIKSNIDERSSKKVFDLKLDEFGPYSADYTRNGRHLVIGGHKGHLALIDWTKMAICAEIHVRETVRHVKFLHDHTMFAVAQKKYTYIYDQTGVELHCLRNHVDVNKIDFLPYHYLMTTVNKSGFLKYQDTSTGQIVAEHRTKMGDCNVMRQNKRNAIVYLGHNNGTVSLWSPNMSTYCVKILCHSGPVQAAAISGDGNHLATAGLDGQVNVWDNRMYKKLHSYFSIRPANSLDISDTGLLAVAGGPHVQVWKDALVRKAQSPYLVHRLPGENVEEARFCPFEDVLGIGHSGGFSSIVVPGSGEANFDTFESNPFENKQQRRERTVHSLLNKLQPDMISLKSVFGLLDSEGKEDVAEAKKKAQAEERRSVHDKNEAVNKKRGRNSSSKRWLRKRTNIVDEKKFERAENIKKIHAKRKADKEDKERKEEGKATPALRRFDALLR